MKRPDNIKVVPSNPRAKPFIPVWAQPRQENRELFWSYEPGNPRIPIRYSSVPNRKLIKPMWELETTRFHRLSFTSEFKKGEISTACTHEGIRAVRMSLEISFPKQLEDHTIYIKQMFMDKGSVWVRGAPAAPAYCLGEASRPEGRETVQSLVVKLKRRRSESGKAKQEPPGQSPREKGATQSKLLRSMEAPPRVWPSPNLRTWKAQLHGQKPTDHRILRTRRGVGRVPVPETQSTTSEYAAHRVESWESARPSNDLQLGLE